MKLVVAVALLVFALPACKDQPADPAAEAPASETESAKPAAAEPGEDLTSKSCEEFYAYSRDVCLKSLREGLGLSCHELFVQARTSRKAVAGERFGDRLKDLSTEQRVEHFCSNFYEELAKKVAEAKPKSVEQPPKCKEAIEALDTKCLKPMAAGKESQARCVTSLITISNWPRGEQYCEVTTNLVNE